MGRRLRVANVIEEGRYGGPQVRIANVAAEIRSTIDTTVIMPSYESAEFQAKCTARGVAFETVGLTRLTREWRVALKYVILFPVEVFRLMRCFRRKHYDVVHVSGGSWQFKGVIAGRLTGRIVLWHINDTYMPWFIRGIFKVLSGLSDGFIYASNRSMQYYGPLVSSSVPQFIVPAPVDTSEFDPTSRHTGDEELIRDWTEQIVVGTVANVNPVKGIDLLIDAACILNQRLDELVFVVIGYVFDSQRSYFNRLTRRCEHLGVTNLFFLGSRKDVRPLLGRMDIYVCASRFESSPIAVWEAMSMGKAIVSADVGGVSDYIIDGESGRLVDVGSVDGFVDCIDELTRDRDKRKRLGSSARQIAQENLDIRLCGTRHVEAYRRWFYD